jgi:hypothetical protein
VPRTAVRLEPMPESLPRGGPGAQAHAPVIPPGSHRQILPPFGRMVADLTVTPVTVIAWHVPFCFAAATGSDSDRPPVAELRARPPVGFPD